MLVLRDDGSQGRIAHEKSSTPSGDPGGMGETGCDIYHNIALKGPKIGHFRTFETWMGMNGRSRGRGDGVTGNPGLRTED